jgi:4-amino-4-deoxy-L-arabinose transferase-like glycosyltransferase
MTSRVRGLVVAAAVLAALAPALALWGTDLWPPDETRVAEVSREMLADGSWLVPHLNGTPFLEEPPLFYWLQAATYTLAREASAAAARAPAAVAATLGVLATAVLARGLGGAAAITALVLATAPEYWWMARSATPDTANAAATALALALFHLAWRTGRRAALAGAVVAAGAAFWSKSFLGVGVIGVAAAGFLASAGLGRLRAWHLVAAVLGLGALVAAWIVSIHDTGGEDALSFFLVENHFGRLIGKRGLGHAHSVLYYVPNLALGLFPWSIALPAAVAAAWRRTREPGNALALSWAGLATLALSLSAAKRPHYLLPVYPAYAILVARWWCREPEGRLDRLTWRLLAVALLACPVIALGAFAFDPAAITQSGHLRLHLPASPTPWCVAALVTAVAIGFVRAARARRPALAAVAAAACLMLLQAMTALAVLPAFNRYASARALGERLGAAAREGVPLVMCGFPNREALSPFMFYAGRRIPEVDNDELARILAGRACALVGRQRQTELPPDLRRLPSTPILVGGRRFVLVSGRAGGCPSPREAQPAGAAPATHPLSPSAS